MEDLSTALFYDTVPDPWVARAYPSMMGLAAWYADLLLRIRVRTFSLRVPADPHPQASRTWAMKGERVPAKGLEAPTGLALVGAGPEGPSPRHGDTHNAGASHRREGTAA